MTQFSFMHNDVGRQTASQTLRVLTYEVGKMNELYHKAEVYGEVGYLGDQKSEASDALAMLRMWFEHCGWDFQEMMDLGESRYLERMKDIARHGLQDRLDHAKTRYTEDITPE